MTISSARVILCLLSILLFGGTPAEATGTGPVVIAKQFVTANYTIAGTGTSTDAFMFMDTTNNPIWITLPPANDVAGRVISILDWAENSSNNWIYIECAGTDIIANNGGSGEWVISYNGAGLQLISDGIGKWVHWQVL